MENNGINTQTLAHMVESYLKRAALFLEDGAWDKADEYGEKVLDIDPENAQGYLVKLLAQQRVRSLEALRESPCAFDGSNHYQKILRFGDESLKQELTAILAQIRERNFTIGYQAAQQALANATTKADTLKAAQLFEALGDYQDSHTLAMQCREDIRLQENEQRKKIKKMLKNIVIIALALAVLIPLPIFGIPAARYYRAEALLKDGEYDSAIALFSNLGDYKDSRRKIKEAHYLQAESLLEAGEYDAAAAAFADLDDYKDSEQMVIETRYQQGIALVKAGESLEALRILEQISDYKDVNNWIIVAYKPMMTETVIAAGFAQTVALKEKGTVVVTGNNYYGRNDIGNWTGVVAVAAGVEHAVGLKADGTVSAVGENVDHCYDMVNKWKRIVAVAAGEYHTVGLKADGTVVAVGSNGDGRCDVGDWTDIVAIAAGPAYTVGLKANGTVVATGDNYYGQCNVGNWTDIVAVAAGYSHTVGLKADGTVVAVGDNDYDKCDVGDWTDIVAVAAGYDHTVGLKSDGTVVATAAGWFRDGQCDVGDWTDIVAIAAGPAYTVGLKANGTVVATGDNYFGQCNVSGWKNIRLPSKSAQ